MNAGKKHPVTENGIWIGRSPQVRRCAHCMAAVVWRAISRSSRAVTTSTWVAAVVGLITRSPLACRQQ